MDAEDPVLHVLVVGFHHKKGCQVEFSFPPLIEGNSVESHEIPVEWKHIPSLALPDGAHNFTHDTVYFVLPGRKKNLNTVYGVSCYRQMDAKDLINKTADVTRSTVQKSVCVLSRLPLFGLIKAKLELITHAYFEERDFSQVSLLEQTFNNLNSSLTQSLLEGSQIFLGLSARDLVQQYKHRIIVLFKLLLLERRVLVFGSPVESLSHTLLGIVSLFPGMMESGLKQACNQWTRRKLSPTLGVASAMPGQEDGEQFLEVRYHTPQDPPGPQAAGDCDFRPTLDEASGAQGAEDSKDSVQEAPESPSIPREAEGWTPKDRKGKEHRKMSPAKDGDTVTGEKVLNDGRRKSRTRTISNSSQESEKLYVHSTHRTKKNVSEDEAETETTHISPLAEMDKITSIEAVQENVVQSLNLTEEFFAFDNNNVVPFLSENSGKESGLTLASTKRLKSTDEVIEDLDSPESISKIDKEDCFSWEQDRLQLSIDHEFVSEDEKSPQKNKRPISGMSESSSRDSISASEDGKDSVGSASVSSLSEAGAKGGNRKTPLDSPSTKERKSKLLKNRLSAAFTKVGSKAKPKAEKEGEEEEEAIEGDIVLVQDKSGYPLAIFTKGSVCLPYLSLQYHDTLTDVNIRSFLIGATNILFKQRRQLIDVIVEVEDSKVEIRDRELQRQLSLTTADLRFADYLVKTVTEDKSSFYDGTEWEGSDEWIRAQFKHYLNSLLSSVLEDDAKTLEDFGLPFLSAWKTTHNFRFWSESEHPMIKVFPPGHPFQGNLSMTDVRMRFNLTLQNSERGKKINAAVVQTGKYVVQTGRAVGGVFTSAKSAVSGWFSTWRAGPDKTEGQEAQPTSPKEEEAPTEHQEDQSAEPKADAM